MILLSSNTYRLFRQFLALSIMGVFLITSTVQTTLLVQIQSEKLITNFLAPQSSVPDLPINPKKRSVKHLIPTGAGPVLFAIAGIAILCLVGCGLFGEAIPQDREPMTPKITYIHPPARIPTYEYESSPTTSFSDIGEAINKGEIPILLRIVREDLPSDRRRDAVNGIAYLLYRERKKDQSDRTLNSQQLLRELTQAHQSEQNRDVQRYMRRSIWMIYEELVAPQTFLDILTEDPNSDLTSILGLNLVLSISDIFPVLQKRAQRDGWAQVNPSLATLFSYNVSRELQLGIQRDKSQFYGKTLIQLLQHHDFTVVEFAADSLGIIQLSGGNVIERLRQSYLTIEQREASQTSFRKIRTQVAIKEALKKYLLSNNPSIVVAATEALVEFFIYPNPNGFLFKRDFTRINSFLIKLEKTKRRLEQLLPDSGLTPDEKKDLQDRLQKQINIFSTKVRKIKEKSQKLHDKRGSYLTPSLESQDARHAFTLPQDRNLFSQGFPQLAFSLLGLMGLLLLSPFMRLTRFVSSRGDQKKHEKNDLFRSVRKMDSGEISPNDIWLIKNLTGLEISL